MARIVIRTARESSVERKVVRDARLRHGVLATKIKGSMGDPDQIFWVPGGKPFLVEFKRPGEKQSGLRETQRIKHLIYSKLGYDIESHDNPDEALEAIEKRLSDAGKMEPSRRTAKRGEVASGARGGGAVRRRRGRED